MEAESLTFLKDEKNRKPVEVTISGPTSLMRSHVVPRLSKFLSNHKNILLNINMDDFEDRLKKVKTGQVDFAFVRQSLVPNELEGRSITPDRFLLIGPSAWRSREITSIIKQERIIDFDPSDDMTFSYLKKFKLLGKNSLQRHFVNNIESLVDLIEAGHGYGVLEEKFVEVFLSKRKICILNHGLSIENRMALCWSPRPVQSKLFKDIIFCLCSL
jgi:DNA-binding transcriptional LysR family regulator